MRVCLIWLMALAMPVQGLAASTMAWCGAAHARVALHAAHDPAMAHGSPDASPLAVEPHGAASDAAPAAHGDGGSHRCNVCAACCSMSTLPMAFEPVAAAAMRHAAPVAEVATGQPSVVGEGPERPPRPRHA